MGRFETRNRCGEMVAGSGWFAGLFLSCLSTFLQCFHHRTSSRLLTHQIPCKHLQTWVETSLQAWGVERSSRAKYPVTSFHRIVSPGRRQPENQPDLRYRRGMDLRRTKRLPHRSCWSRGGRWPPKTPKRSAEMPKRSTETTTK